MADKLDQIEKRLIDLDLRVSKLEGSVEPENKRRKFPVFAVVLLIVGAWLLFNWLPGLFFGYGYGYGRIFGGFNLFTVIIALALGWWGFRKFQEYREKPPSKAEEREIGLVTEKASLAELREKVEESKKEPLGEKAQSFEYQIASHWFSIVGIIAIVVGVVFFLKFAFDNKLIGPVGQVSIGIFVGLILLGAGEYFRSKYQKYSQVITGGGVLVLYLSLWASFGLFHLLDAYFVLAGMSLVTVAAALFSIRYQAIYIAVLGILGGFVTPMLLVKGVENELFIMGYVLILDSGVLLMAIFQNWQKLNVLSFAATFIVFTSWYSDFYRAEKLWPTFVFLTLVFLTFGLVYFVYNIVNEKKTEDTDVLLMLLNAAVYFGFSYLLLNRDYHDWLGFFAFALALFYFIFGYVSYQKFKEDSVLTLGFLGISIVFLTLAVPLQVKKNLITLIWSIEGLALLWAGFWINSYKLRVAALAIYLLVAGRLLFFDSNLPLSEFTLILNRRFLTFLVAAISAGGAGWLYYFYKGRTVADENRVLPTLLVVLNVVLVAALSLESISYFDKQIEKVRSSAKRISMSEVRVLGIQSISRSISGPFDDVSVTCSNLDNAYVYLGVDTGCEPNRVISSRFLFNNVDIPKNSRISEASISVVSADSYLSSTSFRISVSKGSFVHEATGSAVFPTSYEDNVYIDFWNKDESESLGGFTGQIQQLVNRSDWQSGDSILVTVEGVVGDAGYRRIYGYESDPTRVASLTITYNTDNSSSFGGVYSQDRQRSNTQDLYRNRANSNVAVQPDRVTLDKIKGLESARDVSLSTIWLLYSVILLVVGIVKKYKPIRISALVFLGVTILKVFLYDSRLLESGYRIIAFIGLGVILLGVSLAYQKYKAKIEAFLLND